MARQKSEVLTVQEACNRLKLNEVTIRRMLKDGRLRGIKMGRRWRVYEDSVEALLEGGKDPNAHV
jgi:excisionase family DNA binding protein